MRMKQGNFKLAGENYKIALAKDPKLTEAREGLANAYEQAGDKAKAEEERKKLPAAKPSVPTVSPPSAPSAPPGKEAAGDEGFLPALDSVSAQGAEGIYAQKDFLDALGYYRQNKPEAMAPALRRCLARQPGHPGAYYLGGLMRYEKGDYAKAGFNFKRSFAYPARGFNAYFYLGRIYQRQQRVPEAIAAYEKYLSLSKSEPGRKQAEAYLAQLRGAKKENPLAQAPENKAADTAKATDSAKVTEPPAKAAAEGTAKAAEEGSQTPAETARNPVEAAKALILGRDGSFFYLIPDKAAPSGKSLQRAYDLCLQEKFEKAVNTLKETVLNYGGSDNAQAAGLDLASVYLRLGLWENARDRIRDYLGDSPRDSLTYYDAAQYLLALANLGLKDGEQAEKALLKTHPGNPARPGAGATGPSQEEIDYRLAQASGLQQDSKKQSGYMEKAYASSRDPARRAELAQQLGLLYAKYGNADRSQEYFRKSMRDCKDSALAEMCGESQLRLADMAFKKKDWKGAMSQYRAFAAKYPDHKESAWVHYQMANIYKLTNNFESALNEYKRVIDNYPDSYWSSQAKWKREDTIWQKEYEEVLD
jgi:tetratricopeptide (TPR) repeat protein